MERTMELAKKYHYSTFCKHLPVRDPFLCVDFLKEIHVHYDMNLELEMIEKL